MPSLLGLYCLRLPDASCSWSLLHRRSCARCRRFCKWGHWCRSSRSLLKFACCIVAKSWVCTLALAGCCSCGNFSWSVSTKAEVTIVAKLKMIRVLGWVTDVCAALVLSLLCVCCLRLSDACCLPESILMSRARFCRCSKRRCGCQESLLTF